MKGDVDVLFRNPFELICLYSSGQGVLLFLYEVTGVSRNAEVIAGLKNHGVSCKNFTPESYKLKNDINSNES